MKRSMRPVVALSLTLAACSGSEPASDVGAAQDVAAPDASAALDFESIAGVLLHRLNLQPGERVLLVGVPGRFDALVPHLRQGIVAAGAEDLGAWSEAGTPPEGWGTDFTAALGTGGDALMERLRTVDASVMLPGAAPAHTIYGALQEVLREGHGRTVHFHWAGAYRLNGTLRDSDPEVDAFYQWVLAETDYAALSVAQQGFEDAMRGRTIRVTTPGGTDISFRIGDRPVTKQDGDASAMRATAARNLIDREVELPAGAIRVAPLEETVQGRIAFPPAYWADELVEGLVLSFERGRVVDVTATSNTQAVEAEMEASGPPSRAFREFALGFNPLLAIPDDGDPWIPYYGYGAGVVRLSLGDNIELGGTVGGGYVRWNFFTDATVTVDGNVWVEGGKLVR